MDWRPTASQSARQYAPCPKLTRGRPFQSSRYGARCGRKSAPNTPRRRVPPSPTLVHDERLDRHQAKRLSLCPAMSFAVVRFVVLFGPTEKVQKHASECTFHRDRPPRVILPPIAQWAQG